MFFRTDIQMGSLFFNPKLLEFLVIQLYQSDIDVDQKLAHGTWACFDLPILAINVKSNSSVLVNYPLT